MANNLAAFNAEQWSSRLVQKLDQVNVMLPLVNRDWEGDLAQSKTVWVRTPGNISMGTYTKATAISYQDLAPTKESFTVADASYFAFQVDDIDKAQTDINAMDVYMKRSIVTLNNAVESKLTATYTNAPVANQVATAVTGSGAILTPVITAGAIASVTVTNGGTGYNASGLLIGFLGDGTGATATVTVASGVITAVTMVANGTNYTTATPVLTTSTAVTLDSSVNATGIYPAIVRARAVLGKANVPAQGRFLVIDPDSTSLLLNDTAHFVRATDLGDRVVQSGSFGDRSALEAPGFVGRCAGFDVYESSHVPVSSGSKFLIFGNSDAISYAAQITEIEALRLQTYFASAVRGLLLHDTFVPAEGAKRLGYIKATA